MTAPVGSSISAGVLSGVVGLLVFLLIHHVWIKPIWMIFVPGFLIAAVGGVAVGWAYFHVQASLPPRPWNSLAVLAIITAILLPGVLLSFTHGPLFDLAIATIPDRKSTRLNSSHLKLSRMPSSA